MSAFFFLKCVSLNFSSFFHKVFGEVGQKIYTIPSSYFTGSFMPERSANISTHDPFGSLLGYAPGGIAIYSSDYHYSR